MPRDLNNALAGWLGWRHPLVSADVVLTNDFFRETLILIFIAIKPTQCWSDIGARGGRINMRGERLSGDGVTIYVKLAPSSPEIDGMSYDWIRFR